QRKKVLNGDNLSDIYVGMMKSIVDSTVVAYCSEEEDSKKWDWFSILAFINNTFPSETPVEIPEDDRGGLFSEALVTILFDEVREKYSAKEKEMTEKTMREAERVILLRVVDDKWMDHIDAMDQLRQGIGLRAYGQRDPVVEYKFEGFEMFEEMNASIRENAVKVILGIKAHKPESLKPRQRPMNMNASHGSRSSLRTKRSVIKVGRNDPCPCGSGKKYKKCCGK
ncbi:MAG: SEC-C domain-containing protein, partial [Clostridiales bacterium]|nr:SEC-C domain-containing protein [Clostridiales bacterium]